MNKDLSIKETSKMIKCMEKEFSTMDKINQHIKDNGLKINFMDMGFFIINTHLNFKMNLKLTFQFLFLPTYISFLWPIYHYVYSENWFAINFSLFF